MRGEAYRLLVAHMNAPVTARLFRGADLGEVKPRFGSKEVSYPKSPLPMHGLETAPNPRDGKSRKKNAQGMRK